VKKIKKMYILMGIVGVFFTPSLYASLDGTVNGTYATYGIPQNLPAFQIKQEPAFKSPTAFPYPDMPPTTKVPSSVVPEPSTIIAGALLLLPFGVSTLRILRRKKMQ
jgi:hypothetical protein